MTPTTPNRPAARGLPDRAARLLAGLALAVLAACQTIPPPAPRNDPLLPDVTEALGAARASGAGRTRAKLPDSVANDLAPTLQMKPPKLSAKQAEPRFDLNVSNATPQQLLAAIVTDTRYSVIVDPELKGAITLALKDVTVREALDVIRDMYRFEYRFDGNRIFVGAPSLQVQVFKVNFLTLTRSGRSDVRVVSGSLTNGPGGAGGPGGAPTPAVPGATPTPSPGGATGGVQESSRVTTTTRNDVWAEIEATLRLLVGDKNGASIVVSPQTGTIVVRAYPPEMRQVERYLKAARLNIERQVMLEAKIVEVRLTDGFQAGINWAAFNHGGNRLSGGQMSPASVQQTAGVISNAALAADPGTNLVGANGIGQGLFGLAFQTGSFTALLNFLETQGTVQVLSSPRVATLNNQKAVLKVGTDDFFVTNVSTTTATSGTGNVTSPTITVQPFFSGIALDVTPQIDEHATIMLHVHPSVSVVQERAKVINLGSLGTFTLPLASSNVNETDSVVRVENGNIVAIGGLMKQTSSLNRSQIPGSQELPTLGGLLGSRSRDIDKYELVILIKPTVVQSAQEEPDNR
jgi:MSHA biogenesis protein MshL